MHFLVINISVILLVGCQSSSISNGKMIHIANSLEKRITDEEAGRIVLDDTEDAVQMTQASADRDDSRRELEILTKHRQRLTSRVESFLSRRRNGDQLWLYRTHATPDGRGGNSGFAFVREGKVVEQMGVVIYD